MRGAGAPAGGAGDAGRRPEDSTLTPATFRDGRGDEPAARPGDAFRAEGGVRWTHAPCPTPVQRSRGPGVGPSVAKTTGNLSSEGWERAAGPSLCKFVPCHAPHSPFLTVGPHRRKWGPQDGRRGILRRSGPPRCLSLRSLSFLRLREEATLRLWGVTFFYATLPWTPLWRVCRMPSIRSAARGPHPRGLLALPCVSGGR